MTTSASDTGTVESPPATAGAGASPGPDESERPAGPRLDLRQLFAFDAARSLPLIVGLIILWIWFDRASGGIFFGGQNISDILINACQIGVVAIGVVVVLLMAEIDLSLGSLVALCGCSSALIMQEWVPNAPDFERMLVGVAASLIIGAICGFWNGFWVAVVRVPSFVVTLAALLSFQGIALYITNSQTIGVTSAYFNALGATESTVLNSGYLANIWGDPKNIVHLSIGMLLALAMGIGYLVFLLLRRRDRTRNGLLAPSLVLPFVKAAGLTLVSLLVVEKLDYFRGIPIPVIIFVGLLVFFAYILGRTRYGRHIYAVGGNAEAARRSSIPVQRLRWSAFVISGTMAGAGAVILTAQNLSISAGTVGPDVLLNCIAAAVIGGVSLFGGRGSVWSVLLGSLILASVQQGILETLAGGSSNGFYETFIAKGAILLLAVALDTIAVGGRGSGVGLWASNVFERAPALAKLPGMRRPSK